MRNRRLFVKLNRVLSIMVAMSVIMSASANELYAAVMDQSVDSMTQYEDSIASEESAREEAEPLLINEPSQIGEIVTDNEPGSADEVNTDAEMQIDDEPEVAEESADSYDFDLDDFYVNQAFLLYGSARIDSEEGYEIYDEELEEIPANLIVDDEFRLTERVNNDASADYITDEELVQAASNRTTSQEGIDLIKQWEGFRSKAYKALSTEKYYTIGYGHYGPDVTPDMVITLAEGEALLKQDVKTFENKLNEFCRNNNVFLSQNQFDALISFSYNVGTSWLSDSTIRRYILDGFDKHSDQDYKDALAMWCKSGGKVIQGLVNRRAAEGELFVKYRLVYENNGLKLTMECPRIIGCKSATTFSFKCEGGSGSYEYKINRLFYNDGSGEVDVYDVSYGTNAICAANYFQFAFYVPGDYYLRVSVRDKSSGKEICSGAYDMPLMVRDSSCRSIQDIVASVAASCNSAASTEYDKALWLHDYIIKNAQIDNTHKFCSAEAVLARGKGTSEAYHRAYAMLLSKVGLQSARAEGNGAVWTVVRINNKWYQIDTALDDSTAASTAIDVTHLYFGITDDIMKTVHSEHSPVSTRACTNLESNYFIRTGAIRKFSDSYKDAIIAGFNAGNIVVDVPYIQNATKGKYDNVLLPLILYELKQNDYDGRKVTIEYSGSSVIATENISAPVVKKAYLSLKGKTDLVFVVALPENLKTSTSAYAELKYGTKKVKINVSDAVNNAGLYDFPISLPAKDLRQTVTFRIYSNASTPAKISNYNGTIYEYKYSVVDYVEAVKDTSVDTKLKNMLSALMNYGICAERYLNDSDDALPATLASVKYAQFMPYEYNVGGSIPGIRYIGTSLLLEDSVSIRHYFELESGTDFSAYTISADGKELEKHSQGNQCYVEINNIFPTDYDKMYKVTVLSSGKTMNIEYSVYAYGERALYMKGASEEIGNVMRAMYLYGTAAKQYFGKIVSNKL